MIMKKLLNQANLKILILQHFLPYIKKNKLIRYETLRNKLFKNREFEKIVKYMKNGSYIIIDTSNVRFQNLTSSLAWDVANTINRINNLEFLREIIVCWQGNNDGFLGGTYGFGYDHSYCLVYKVNHKKS